MPPAVARKFWADLSASETLSCLLLDAAASGYRLSLQDGKDTLAPLGTLLNKIVGAEAGSGVHESVEKEIVALYELLQLTNPNVEPPGHTEKKADVKEVLPDDAAIYVCWYSQLRELVERRPGLAEDLTSPHCQVGASPAIGT